MVIYLVRLYNILEMKNYGNGEGVLFPGVRGGACAQGVWGWL